MLSFCVMNDQPNPTNYRVVRDADGFGQAIRLATPADRSPDCGDDCNAILRELERRQERQPKATRRAFRLVAAIAATLAR
jgi:hypothetical protein